MLADCFREWLNNLDCYGSRLKVPAYHGRGKTIDWICESQHEYLHHRGLARFGEQMWEFWDDLAIVERNESNVIVHPYDLTKSPIIEWELSIPEVPLQPVMLTEVADDAVIREF